MWKPVLFIILLLSGLACKDRATVEKPRQPVVRPAERPVEVPAPPPVVRPVQPPPIFPPGPVASKPEPVPAPVRERCYVLRVSGGVPRVTESMACPAVR